MSNKSATSQQIQPFRLACWQIYPDSGEILSEQETHHLEPKTMAVLCALAFEPDRTLSRSELIARVWGDAVVTEEVVTRIIYKLRQVLGDDSQQAIYIQTLPKLGYRLLVTPQVLEPGQKAGNNRKLIAGLIALLTILGLLSVFLAYQSTEDIPADQAEVGKVYSIAVLPFEDFRPAAPDDHLAESITDELINSLAHLKQLRVVARTSVFSFRESSLDVRQLGAVLNANTVVEGSIRRNGDHLRLIVQVIDVKSGYHLLSETIEREPEDIFSFSAQVIPSLVRVLNIKPGADELARASAVPAHSEAQKLTIRGRYHWHRRNQDALQKALDYFERAIELAPDYAPAYSGLSDTLVFSTLYGERKLSDVKKRARESIDRALKLDPGLAGAHASLGLLQLHLGQHPQALQSLQKATSLNPNNAMAHMWSGRSHFTEGRFLKAMLAYQRSAALDPVSPIIYQNIGMAGLLAGETEQAESAYQKSIEFAPDNPYSRWALAYLLWSKGDLSSADKVYSSIIEQGLKRADVIAQASMLALDSGDLEKARARLELAKSINQEDDWVSGAEWAYHVSQRQYKKIKSGNTAASNDDLARQAIAGFLDDDFQFAFSRYSKLLEQGQAGDDILFDQWSVEWGFAHALYLQQLYLRLGDENAARVISKRFEEFFWHLREQGLRTAGTDYIAASISAVNNRPELALTHLTIAIDRGWSKLWWITQDPAFHSLADHPGFIAQLAKLRERTNVAVVND